MHQESEIQTLRNLGPKCEQDLNAVGIFTRAQLQELGPEEAYRRVYLGRKARGESVKTMNAMYLYALHGAIHDCSCLELNKELQHQYRAFAAYLRGKSKLP